MHVYPPPQHLVVASLGYELPRVPNTGNEEILFRMLDMGFREGLFPAARWIEVALGIGLGAAEEEQPNSSRADEGQPRQHTPQ